MLSFQLRTSRPRIGDVAFVLAEAAESQSRPPDGGCLAQELDVPLRRHRTCAQKKAAFDGTLRATGLMVGVRRPEHHWHHRTEIGIMSVQMRAFYAIQDNKRVHAKGFIVGRRTKERFVILILATLAHDFLCASQNQIKQHPRMHN